MRSSGFCLFSCSLIGLRRLFLMSSVSSDSENCQQMLKMALWLSAISWLSMIMPINSSLKEMMATLSS